MEGSQPLIFPNDVVRLRVVVRKNDTHLAWTMLAKIEERDPAFANGRAR